MIDFDFLRLVCSFLTGAMICQSGSLIQGITQNSLASPATLGFQALIVLIILVLNSLNFNFPLEYGAIIAGLLFVITFIVISKFRKNNQQVYSNRIPQKINSYILMGLGINLLVGAIFAIWHFFYMAMNKEFPSQIWFGHFRYVDTVTTVILLSSFVLINIYQFQYIKKLQLLNLGVDFYSGLGHDISSLQRKVVVIVFIQTLIIVSLFGVFSFAALIMPLVLRRFSFFASSSLREIVIGGLLGGIFFSLLDLICYNLTFYGAELPVGMLSSTIGAAVMVLLLIRQKIRSS